MNEERDHRSAHDNQLPRCKAIDSLLPESNARLFKDKTDLTGWELCLGQLGGIEEV